MMNSTLWLSQLQFFLSLGFMSLFLVIEIGLAWVLLYFKVRAHWSGQAGWTAAYRFWVRVFALAVIMTLASSMPVLIQFGSLWPFLMDKIGEIAGPLFAGTILTTFIFKSCFLGAMLFGQRRLSDRIHTVVVFMVAVGVTFAALWMIVLQSWMQTPAGAILVNGRYYITDWYDIVFNPSVGWSVGLLLAISALAVAFLILGVCTKQAFRHPLDEGERLAFKTGLNIAMVGVIVLTIFMAGYGLMSAEHHPAKAAATAGYWHSGVQPDLVLFAWPDTATASNRLAITWSHAGGRWLGQDNNGQYLGLDHFSGMHGPVVLLFWSFRLMVVIGLFMGLLSWLSFFKLRKHQYDPGSLSKRSRAAITSMTFSGWVLCIASLSYMLFGLLPYVVNGAVTISEVVGNTSPDVVLAGLVAYIVLYAFILLGFLQLLSHVARYGVVPVARRRGRA